MINGVSCPFFLIYAHGLDVNMSRGSGRVPGICFLFLVLLQGGERQGNGMDGWQHIKAFSVYLSISYWESLGSSWLFLTRVTSSIYLGIHGADG